MNQLDKTIRDLREQKAVLQSLERLIVNSDFKKVILDDFLSKHPLELVLRKGQLNLDPQLNQDIDRQLECVALFKMYLDKRIDELDSIDTRILEAEHLRDEMTRNM